MLERVGIQNFRCLKTLDVQLRPLTVLIGPNDSGKSAFLAALLALGEDKGLAQEDFWRLQLPGPVRIRARSGKVVVEHVTSKPGQAQRVIQPTGLDEDVDPSRPVLFFALPASGVTMRASGHADDGQPPELDSAGSNIAALVDYLLRRDRRRFDAFLETMRQRVPGLDDFYISTPKPQVRRIDLVIDNGLVIEADRASVGVRLLLFFVALSYHPSPPKVILLEEPENGLHPRRLGDVLTWLRDITKGKHCGQAAQVILATHSPYLLDFVDLDQDQVLVFRRNDDGSRTAEAVDADRLKTFLDDFMLGEVWFNEQEEGLLKRGD